MLAANHQLASLAFPSISTGAYGYPRAEAAAVASKAIEAFLSTDNVLQEVRLVFFQSSDQEVFIGNHKFKGPPL
jgi:O-acetyl-ADP-ribose deacetylase (regulator of RNase III)